jgi:hypothetical protein
MLFSGPAPGSARGPWDRNRLSQCPGKPRGTGRARKARTARVGKRCSSGQKQAPGRSLRDRIKPAPPDGPSAFEILGPNRGRFAHGRVAVQKFLERQRQRPRGPAPGCHRRRRRRGRGLRRLHQHPARGHQPDRPGSGSPRHGSRAEGERACLRPAAERLVQRELHRPGRGATASGVLLGSSGTGRLSTASRLDYAQAAAAVLASGSSETCVYELAGDEAFTLAELAAVLAEASGRPVVYKDLPEADYAAALQGVGIPPSLARLLADNSAKAASDTLFEDGHALSKLIARPTTPIREAVRAHLSSPAA